MNAAPRFDDPATLARQAEASDPRRSVWVSANAGSGKTYVLARRVVRLLLAGADPARLLCLTFTKAAAAEMARRVFDILAGWIPLDDDALAAELARYEGRPPTGAMLADARRLFARALETPGGLKIQTVHAFCERLLHQFPFEANVAGHFHVLDETAANVLVTDSQRAVLSRAARDLDGPLGRALVTVVLAASDRGHESAVAELVEKRGELGRWLAAADAESDADGPPLDKALAQLRQALGVRDGGSAETLTARILSDAALDASAVARLVAVLEPNGGNDAKAAARLAPYITAASDSERLAAYRAFFCKSDGAPRKASTLVTMKVKNRWPGLEEILEAECARIEGLLGAIAAAETYATSAAVIRLAEAVVDEYQRRKIVRGLLDFDDLIEKTLGLLRRSDAAPWVHYKIDQGLDHILLDEAQDTSPGQWQVIQALADDFYAGEGARPGVRTLFAVGDEKQSIYSFQGAVPAWFDRVRRVVRAKAAGAAHPFSDVRLTLSFRSTPDIVGAVDRIYAPEIAHDGLASEREPPVHEAARRGEPGEVVVWPMVDQPPEPRPGAWEEPLDHIGDAAPEAILGRRIAATVAGWIASGERLEATGKPIRPGEVLVLVRKRGAVSESINRALKRAGVPVAGADRLFLADHIVFKDLLALADVVLQDRDDLALAALLKSPLFGLGEDALYALAHGRKGSLWLALRDAADAEPFAELARVLGALRARVDAVGPYAFYAEVLGPRKGRRRFAARLGAEAEDVIDEFLAQTLVYERVETPSLQGFVAWMRSTATEIRRETEIERDEVRVMTVHGAKGLEADVVFLVDDGSSPAHSGHDPDFLAITDDPDAAAPAPLVWTGGGNLPPAVRDFRNRHRDRARQEYRRLLYVAATRARDRLIVCGVRRETGTDPDTGWHALVSRALLPEARAAVAADGSPAFVWRLMPPAAPATAVPAAGPSPTPAPPLPGWLGSLASTARALRSLKPSAVLAPPQGIPGYGLAARLAGPAEALERGRIVHRLLEALPAQEPVQRDGIARRYLDWVAAGWPGADREALLAGIALILDDPRFAPVFAPGSRPEVDIAADIEISAGTAVVSGRIDRLAVTGAEVLIVDYKTNRPPPAVPQDVPASYVGQLALYRLVLRRLYPGHVVRAALLWTETPALMEIPAEMLDAAERAALGIAVPATRISPTLA